MSRLTIKISDLDNVAVAVQDLDAGTEILPGLRTLEPIPQAHKIALTPSAQAARLSATAWCWATQSTISPQARGSTSIC